MTRTIARFRATAFLVVLAGYLLFNYAFMQLRIPPVGFGLPLGELLIVLFLLTTDLPRVLQRMGATVILFPFIVWWSWGFARLAFDTWSQGFWAFRDGTQLIESLFLIVGFTLAGQPGMVARLMRWLKPVIVTASLIGLLSMYEAEIVAISPTLPGASGQPISIFAPFAASSTMLLWGASFLIIRQHPDQSGRIRSALLAGFLVAFGLVVIQQRTTYVQLLAVAGLMFALRPRALRLLGIAIPLLVALLVVITAFDLKISGRLTTEISLSFFSDHILSIFGIGQGELAPSAEGVDLRMGWWTRLYDRLTADEATLITGLGYGIPLTNFSDTLGVVTREPHNSIVSVTARLGLIGIVSWLWMQSELFRAAFRAYRECLRTRRNEVANFILVCLAFVVLTIGACFGEDTFEKPYNAIPYYAFWGILLRIAYELRCEPLRDRFPAPQAVALQRSSPS
jgi:hypothetical protein